MPAIELPPTKSSLRKLKEDLSFAYEGYDLLNQKREILALEIVRKMGEIRRIEADFQKALDELYAAYRSAAVDMGGDKAVLQSAAEPRNYFLHTEMTRLMGLKLSNFSIRLRGLHAPVAVTATTASYDEAKDRARKMLPFLVSYASVSQTVIILSRELKKVQRRVNALEKIFIPQHEETKRYIVGRIEEMEREEVFVKKIIRQRQSVS